MSQAVLHHRVRRTGSLLILLSVLLLAGVGVVHLAAPAEAQPAPSGSITVTKYASWDPDLGFDFTLQSVGVDPPVTETFTLKHQPVPGWANVVFSALPLGQYQISEVIPTGWHATGISCLDGSGSLAFDGNEATGSVTVTLTESLTHVECYFSNDFIHGTLVVQKITNFAYPLEVPTVFDFDASWSDTNFTLTSGDVVMFSLPPGRHSVTELAEPGWQLNLARCGEGENNPDVDGDPNDSDITVDLADGQTIGCRFINQNSEGGKIIVDKVSSPAGGPPFEFDPSWSSQDFMLGDGDPAYEQVLPPGTYSITEEDEFLWTLSGVACTDAAGASMGTAGPAGVSGLEIIDGRVITCTFTNTEDPHGSITVTKAGGPPDGASFTVATTGFSSTATVLPGVPWDLGDVPAGAYTITEQSPLGWTPTATCTNQYSEVFFPGAFTLDSGEEVTCAFTNHRDQGYIRIVKQLTDPAHLWGGELFGFDVSWSDTDLTLPVAGPVWQTGLIALPTTEGNPGQVPYSVVETTPPADWFPTGASCASDQTAEPILPGSVNLHKLETVTCTFVNERAPIGSLTVVKDAPPGDDTEFAFTAAAGTTTPVPFTLRDPSGPSAQFASPGPYTVTEVSPLPDGWAFTDVACTGAADWSHDGPVLSVTVGRDEAVICTFTNQRLPGRIVVQKAVPTPDAPADSFTFTPSWGGSFVLAGGGSADSGPLLPGVYSVGELLPPGEGWSLAAAFCDDGSSPAAIGLSSRETVTCTFVNRYQPPDEPPTGSLTVVKETTPDGGSGFVFEGSLGGFTLHDGGSQSFDGLAAGAYTVTETPAAGWEFEEVVCTTVPGAAVDYQPAGAGVTVNLAEGQDVTCVFTNREEGTVGPGGSLTINKETVPAGGAGFGFDAGGLGSFSLDDGGSQTFTALAAGTYTVAEVPAEGWAFSQVVCDALDWEAAGAGVTVNLAEGEAAACTFTNGQLPYTGASLWLPLLLAGLAGLLTGLGLWVWSLMKAGERA